MRYMYWFQFMAISSFGKRHCFSKPWDAFWAPCFQTNPSNPLPLLLMSIFLATSHLLIYTWTKVYPLKLFQTGDWFSQSRPTLLTQHSIGTHMVGILVNYCYFCQNKIKSPPVHTKIAGISECTPPNVRNKGLLTHHHMVKLHPKRGQSFHSPHSLEQVQGQRTTSTSLPQHSLWGYGGPKSNAW